MKGLVDAKLIIILSLVKFGFDFFFHFIKYSVQLQVSARAISFRF